MDVKERIKLRDFSYNQALRGNNSSFISDEQCITVCLRQLSSDFVACVCMSAYTSGPNHSYFLYFLPLSFVSNITVFAGLVKSARMIKSMRLDKKRLETFYARRKETCMQKTERKGTFGKHRHRWKDNIKQYRK